VTQDQDGARRRTLAETVARIASEGSHRVAVAESLTGGLLSNDLAKAPDASDWFLGGVVSYATEVKQQVLQVRPGPVVSREAAKDMAGGVARLLDATTSVSVTGVGGPDSQDGMEPGTVWIGVSHAGTITATLHHFDGDPEEICEASCRAALEVLVSALTGQGADAG
jgi:nicotinamide-nucleotide amidase